MSSSLVLPTVRVAQSFVCCFVDLSMSLYFMSFAFLILFIPLVSSNFSHSFEFEAYRRKCNMNMVLPSSFICHLYGFKG